MIHNRFREALETGRFVVSVEALPGRGACEASQVKMMEEACQVWDSGLADAISVTDAPSGTPALLADAFAGDLLARGAVPLVHFTCKDRNRNQIEAQLYAMQRAGIENLLCMTGDAPTNGWQGQARPVFDLDPVTMIQLVSDMNKGMTYRQLLPRRGGLSLQVDRRRGIHPAVQAEEEGGRWCQVHREPGGLRHPQDAGDAHAGAR